MQTKDRLYNILDSQYLWSLVLMGMAVLVGFMINSMELLGVMVIFAIVPAGAYFYFLVNYPIVGLYTALNLAFFANGFIRYVPIPFGLAMDGIFFLTVIIVLLKSTTLERQNLKVLPVYVFAAWFLYTIFQLFNPQAPNFLGWFYAVRGTSFNFLFIIILTVMLMRDKKNLKQFIWIWLGWSLLGLIWGFKQKFVGLDGAENAWLAAGNASTHVLHGKLRVFSFYSDAGQFGAAMAHVSLFALIMAIGPGSFLQRLVYGTLGLAFFYGMAISGTRGALFVPATGGLIYLIANRNFTILIIGIIFGAAAFGLLKYTTVGQGNYEVQRLRSALNTEDASLNVRKENQRKLARYLADKPFGGGIGTSGYFGLRFSPHTFLAQTATDSWYVRIWVETGVVGLFIHAGGLLLLILAGFFKIFTLHDPYLRNTMAALFAGFAGIAFASYGNSVIGQYPSNIVSMISIALVWVCKEWDTVPEDTTKKFNT